MNDIENFSGHISEHLYKKMFKIDFQAAAVVRKFFTDMSFSYITWRNVELLHSGELELSDLEDNQIK